MHPWPQQQPRVFCFTDFPCCHPLLTCGIFDSTPFHVCAARPLHLGSEHVLPPRGKTLCEKLSVTFMCQWYLEVAPGLLGQDTCWRMKSEAEWGGQGQTGMSGAPGNHECWKDRAWPCLLVLTSRKRNGGPVTMSFPTLPATHSA